MRPDKEYFDSRVAAMMRASGVEPPRKDATWGACVGMWFDAQRLSKASQTKYAGELEQFTAFLGPRAKMSVKDISVEDCERFHTELLAGGRTPSTARNTMMRVRAVMKRAVMMGYLEQSPAELVALSTEGVDVQRMPFSREDIARVFAFIAGNGKKAPTVPRETMRQWRVACQFGLYYGMRITDAVSRREEEIVDVDGIRSIRFVQQKKRRKGKVITLPLVGELLDLPQGPGLLTPDLAAYSWPSRRFATILERAGVEVERSTRSGKAGKSVANKSFHSFRHAANSMLSDAGVDLRIRQLICDHEDVSTSMRYTHNSLESMAAAIRKAIPTPIA